MVTWESALQGKPQEKWNVQRWRRSILERLDRKSHFRKVESNVGLSALKLISRFGYLQLTWMRFYFTRLFPFDPLEEEPHKIEIYIFTSGKDLEILPLSIFGSSQCHRGIITRITVVHPQIIWDEVSAILGSMSHVDIPLTQISDEQLLSNYSLSNSSFSRGNIKMEIVKIIAAFESKERFSLLIDGDTVLLKPRNWATSDKHILMVAQEYTRAHIEYNQGFFPNYKIQGLGYVTHHQLLKTTNIKNLVLKFGGVNSMATSFEESSSIFYTNNGRQFPSEWQLMGDFQFLIDNQSVNLVNFSNLGVSRKKLSFLFLGPDDPISLEKKLEFLREKAPGLGSISFHQYKD